MKEAWVRPLTEVQKFVANEYVAACGDTEKGKYLFECDAPAGPLYAHDSSGRGYDGANYSPCKKKHEASTSATFVQGYIDYNGNKRQDAGEAVIVWLEYKKRFGQTYVSNGHATTNLNQETWEVVKS